MSERLRDRREAAGLTLGQVGTYEGITPQYLSQLETGKRTPNVWELLIKLAVRYETSADYLLGITDDPSPATTRGEWTEEGRAVVQLVNSLPAGKRGAALALLQAAILLSQGPTDSDTSPAPANDGGG